MVESSFTSVREMQQYTAYKWIPLGMVQTQYFDSLAKAPKLCMPTLVMHGSNDYRIPVEVAQKLYAATPEPKRWLLVEGARPHRHPDPLHRAVERGAERFQGDRCTATRRLLQRLRFRGLPGRAATGWPQPRPLRYVHG